MWKDFFDGLNRLQPGGKPFVIATVMKVSGSTYRRPGARVIITEDGVSTGLISGGCFEGELIERAKKVLGTREPTLVTFDTTSPDDLIFGLGLGCTGVAQILMEPFPVSTHYLDFIRNCIAERQPGVIATVFRTENVSGVSPGSRMMVKGQGKYSENIQNSDLVRKIYNESVAVLNDGETRVEKFISQGGSAEVLIEFITLPFSMIIFGAGPDAVPLVRFASELGWNVTVVDRRPAFARKELFPSANNVILSEPDELGARIVLNASTAAVVMTHNFEADLKFTRVLLESPMFYIGLLGPAAKKELLLQKLQEDGFHLTEEHLARLYGPVGLDLGAETPEEIALSIVAEIQTVSAGYSGGFLRQRTGPIHKRS
jgi:xanthine dehydrogenase accessory factor